MACLRSHAHVEPLSHQMLIFVQRKNASEISVSDHLSFASFQKYNKVYWYEYKICNRCGHESLWKKLLLFMALGLRAFLIRMFGEAKHDMLTITHQHALKVLRYHLPEWSIEIQNRMWHDVNVTFLDVQIDELVCVYAFSSSNHARPAALGTN